MIEIGIAGLDTSHPKPFAEHIDGQSQTTISAVWDGGEVRTRNYVDQFCERYDATYYDDVTGMLDIVDAVMILTANWDTHRPLAVPFLEAGVPTFVDKPLAGRLSDVEAIADAATDTTLFGGSAIPYHPRVAELPVDEDGRILYCAGYNDPFYYGAHLSDTVRFLADTDWTFVEPGTGPGTSVELGFQNDTWAILHLNGPTEDGAFGVLDVSNRTRTRQVGSDEAEFSVMYDRFVDAFIDVARGKRAATDRLIDGGRLLLAIRAALDTGERITPGSRALERVVVDGEAFLKEYSPYY